MMVCVVVFCNVVVVDQIKLKSFLFCRFLTCVELWMRSCRTDAFCDWHIVFCRCSQMRRKGNSMTPTEKTDLKRVTTAHTTTFSPGWFHDSGGCTDCRSLRHICPVFANVRLRFPPPPPYSWGEKFGGFLACDISCSVSLKLRSFTDLTVKCLNWDN